MSPPTTTSETTSSLSRCSNGRRQRSRSLWTTSRSSSYRLHGSQKLAGCIYIYIYPSHRKATTASFLPARAPDAWYRRYVRLASAAHERQRVAASYVCVWAPPLVLWVVKLSLMMLAVVCGTSLSWVEWMDEWEKKEEKEEDGARKNSFNSMTDDHSTAGILLT